ncbi:MAG: hypothetical protein ACQGVC_24680 [Myxococcota bacterium]
MPISRSILVLLLASSVLGCGGAAWRAALEEDDAGAYHRFLRQHPDSKYAPEARARLAFVRVRSKPTAQAFHEFQEEFAGSPLVDELRPLVEDAFFDQARGRGTAEGYRAFLADFPSGRHSARAEGNAVYLEARGFAGDLERLADFAAAHPASDFAAEAERSVASVGLRSRSGFQRVALVLDVPSDVPSHDRLQRLFAERARDAYARSGVPLVVVNGSTDPRLAELDARLTVSHREREVRTELHEGRVAGSGILAETTVTLSARGEKDPIWNETFAFRAPTSERAPGESILLHPKAWATFWDNEFFVPVATWNTRFAARDPRELAKPAVAVEMLGSRAVVLFGDGDFQVLDLGDPARSVVLGEYRRKRDLASFDGVAVLGGSVGVFGEDGIEVVSLAGVPHRTRAFSRSEVGSVVGLVSLPEGLVAAGNRGLLWIAPDGSVQTLFPREVLGLARRGNELLFTDGTSLYLSSLAVLRGGRVEGELRLGRGFRPARVRVSGTSAVVLGDPGLVRVDVRNVSSPQIVSRLGYEEVGPVQDASVVAGRVFLVGTRGLQVSDRSGDRVVDSVDVLPRHRLDASGRHVVLIGEKTLQVVDATAFTTAAGAASPTPRR